MSASSKELEKILYTISHDLSAPLRHIKFFGEMLFQKLDDKVDQEDREYLEYMQESVVKLEKMISALMDYSHLSEGEEFYDDFQCLETIQSAAEIFEEELNKIGAEISYENIPNIIKGHKGQFYQLFSYLIHNSILHYRGNNPLKIHISAEEYSGQWHFKVQDNGEGIPENQYENVFSFFKRLDPQDGHTGMGIGLTLAKKIIENHGGAIWIETNDQNFSIIFTISPS